MKKLRLIFIFIILFVGLKYVKAEDLVETSTGNNNFDTSLKIYDYAQVLSSSEEAKLKKKIDTYIEKYNMDMVLVTVKHHEKSDTKSYAEDFYDYNGFGIGNTHNGVLFVIDYTFGYRDIYMLTTGEAIRYYDDNRVDSILDSIESVSSKDYYYWFEKFIDRSDYYASRGIPSSNKNTYINEYGDIVEVKRIPWIGFLIVSIILPSIVVFVIIMKHRMIKKSVNANYYLKEDTVNITTRNDRFLTTHTTSVRINDDSSSGSRIGGSSVSRGSSGISHGGGGRRL